MQVRIFTLPFDPETEGFPDEIISGFCSNKKVLRIKSEFFQREGKPFWSVAVHYEVVMPQDTDILRGLDEAQKLLYERLRLWRKEEAAKVNMPAYMLARNSHLVQMVKLRCQTLESFKEIRGFGKKGIQKYGKQIIEIIKGFYESEPAAKAQGETPPSDTEAAAEEKSDVPY